MKPSPLTTIHHIAVPAVNIRQAIEWYQQTGFCFSIIYQDPTWALLQFDNIQMALVVPAQHPPHIAVVHPEAEQFGPLTTHRDGSRST